MKGGLMDFGKHSPLPNDLAEIIRGLPFRLSLIEGRIARIEQALGIVTRPEAGWVPDEESLEPMPGPR